MENRKGEYIHSGKGERGKERRETGRRKKEGRKELQLNPRIAADFLGGLNISTPKNPAILGFGACLFLNKLIDFLFSP